MYANEEKSTLTSEALVTNLYPLRGIILSVLESGYGHLCYLNTLLPLSDNIMHMKVNLSILKRIFLADIGAGKAPSEIMIYLGICRLAFCFTKD